jgi:hypothetical protein
MYDKNDEAGSHFHNYGKIDKQLRHVYLLPWHTYCALCIIDYLDQQMENYIKNNVCFVKYSYMYSWFQTFAVF